MDADDLTMAIMVKIKDINGRTGDVIAGLLYNTLSDVDQIGYAHQLVDIAELIKRRVTGDFRPLVVEGTVHGDHRIGAELRPMFD